MHSEESMTAESTKIWRCPSCNRLLIEKSVDYARARHAEMLARRTWRRRRVSVLAAAMS